MRDGLPYQIIQLERVRQQADRFNVLHFNIDLLQFPLVREWSGRAVTNLHGRLDLRDLAPFHTEFDDIPLVSISKAQRRPMPEIRWVGKMPHGLPHDLLPFQPFPEAGYLAFLGRIAPEKRPDRAMQIALRAGMKRQNRSRGPSYWEQTVRPLINGNPNVELDGEINERQKASFLGNARALLFPIDWPEPFGLVMIEAMACGTPVIAFNCGSVPEVIEDGVSGVIVGSVDEAVEAVRKADKLDRLLVHRAFERHFPVAAMADAYLRIYRELPCTQTKAFTMGRSNAKSSSASGTSQVMLAPAALLGS